MRHGLQGKNKRGYKAQVNLLYWFKGSVNPCQEDLIFETVQGTKNSQIAINLIITRKNVPHCGFGWIY
jgi:hypothetical protein